MRVLNLLFMLQLVLIVGISQANPSPDNCSNPSEFPQVVGANLGGRRCSLPDGFEGERNVVLIAFERDQQVEVETWLPLMRRLEAESPGVRAYELPTLKKMPGTLRGWITGRMASGISDAHARASTIVLFLDKEGFRRSLRIATEKTITLVVTDRSGKVYWQTLGVWTPEKEAVLRTIVTP